MTLENSPLGKTTIYPSKYEPKLLFPVSRQPKRNELNMPTPLPFLGVDIWNAYELSWLNTKGKPVVAIAEFIVPCDSPNIVESKSIKLYLNSFNQTQFSSTITVQETISKDLSAAAGAHVKVNVMPVLEQQITTGKFTGICLDEQDVICDVYKAHPDYLRVTEQEVEETLFSYLLRSNCPITSQPDWGSVLISYTGKKIDQAGLLRYIVSLRNSDEFHEQCVERIFMDVMRCCKPKQLTVYARYTRRGGLDINPYRSTNRDFPGNIRSLRQ